MVYKMGEQGFIGRDELMDSQRNGEALSVDLANDKPHSSDGISGYSFSCAAPRLWNKLPARLQSSPSLPQFKEHLKAHLFNQAFID